MTNLRPSRNWASCGEEKRLGSIPHWVGKSEDGRIPATCPPSYPQGYYRLEGLDQEANIAHFCFVSFKNFLLNRCSSSLNIPCLQISPYRTLTQVIWGFRLFVTCFSLIKTKHCKLRTLHICRGISPPHPKIGKTLYIFGCNSVSPLPLGQ